ncbi:SulP family inorganic anion transporter [Roseinatronobacter sp.]|uniref:SulP family inorganic anion transporter n=1 Tax=Roseinatronobacter sp. TaxID=1945755 RepID=UPI003F6E9A78
MPILKTQEQPARPVRASFAEMFTPKLITVLQEGYRLSHLRADAMAGLTVAIVALPLSMAIAIASGASPAQGLYTAIIGGFIISLLGGSRYQIGGPAGAFIVLVSGTVALHGIDGLILATFLSGIILAALGYLRLGTFVQFVPFPVVVGFTAGIAVIIFASQIQPLLGLTIADEPGALAAKLSALWKVRDTITPAAVALSAGTVAIILGLRRWRPNWPGMLLAVVLGAVAVAVLQLPVETIGSAFGGIPSSLPAPGLPSISVDKIISVLPAAISFAMLGAIESLLSAMVADGMSGRRHRSNCELVAQGAANIGSSLFGGFCVTGTIARTATAVRAGAHGPVAGMLHSVFLLMFMLLAAPLAAYIPLAALAGVLTVVAWNMIEKTAIVGLFRAGWGESTVLAVTFFLTIYRDLIEAIIVGVALGSMVFIHRVSRTTGVSTQMSISQKDEGDEANQDAHYHPDVVIYRIKGALFFGVAGSIGSILDRIQDDHRALIIDLSNVPFLDATGVNMIEGIAHKARKRGVDVWLTGGNRSVWKAFLAHGVKTPLVHFARTIDVALGRISKN